LHVNAAAIVPIGRQSSEEELLAVYVPFEQREIDAVAAAFGLGKVVEWHGIPQGSINTNYRMKTAGGRFFLRHTTVRTAAELEFEAALLGHLHESRFPAPTLVWTIDGRPFWPALGGRVSVFEWLTGDELSRAELDGEHARCLGRELGKLHRITNSFLGNRPNPYGPEVVRPWVEGLLANQDQEIRSIALELGEALAAAEPLGELVPRGVIHGDLFMDNVKWIGDRVSAIFDFEMACRDALVLDLAIALNAWCFDSGQYLPDLSRVLVAGYEEERKLEASELDGLYRASVFGAVRYTASRIRDFHLSGVPAERLAPKDFRTYLARVRALRAIGPTGFRALVGLEKRR
jgi:homoserine kinase type II